MAKKRHENRPQKKCECCTKSYERKRKNFRPITNASLCFNYENITIKQEEQDKMEQPAVNSLLHHWEESGDEVVESSQECVDFSLHVEDDDQQDFKAKANDILSLYEKISGQKYGKPEKSTCKRRDEQKLIATRKKSLNQSDEEFTSLFDDDEMNLDDGDNIHNLSTTAPTHFDPGANYSELCMRSKLTEVGLRYVNNVYNSIRNMNLKTTEYRTQISQYAKVLRNNEEELRRIREEIGHLPPIVLRVLGLNKIQSRTPVTKKAYSD
ncbi:hypothetical protein DICVIV_03245 [Dictyocaulus viviparus]|uniref:Uncharacterized protein n=1 Tax=Dictyocaulus viviparus TaxID=29172 RepID=A0A0D8Y7J2_DICVI|nr:hypothetical protein DICVIV_03245 [Dictyocaulus viviparus]